MRSEHVSFSEIFDFKGKTSRRAGDGYLQGKYPFFTSSETQTKFLNEYDYRGPCIIMGTGGSANIHYCEGLFTTSADCFVASVKTNRTDVAKFYYYFLKSNLHMLEAGFKGAGLRHISKAYVDAILLPHFPPDYQKQVVAILDKADAIRQKRQESIRLTEEFLRSVFLEMFGDPVTNPKGWEIRKFADVGTLDRGVSKNRPRNAPELLGGPYPLIQTGDIANSDGYIRSYKSTYSEVGLRQSKMWPAGTLCITIAANIAKTGILTFDACFPDSVVGFIPNELTTTEYSQYWLGFLQKSLEDNAPESAQKNINLDILRKLNIPVPDIEFQKEFTKRVKTTQDIKSKFASASVQQTQLFESLSQRAFRGEL